MQMPGAGCTNNVRTARVGLGFPPGDAAVMNLNGRAVVCPERLPKVLKAHLERFVRELLDERNRKLRMTFERSFNRDAGIAFLASGDGSGLRPGSAVAPIKASR